MVETVRLLEESKEKCKLWEETLSLPTVQLYEANETNGVLENELVFLERERERERERLTLCVHEEQCSCCFL